MVLTEMFWQITVPIMSTGLFATLALVTSVIVTAHSASKRMDDLRSDMTRRLDKIDTRLDRIEIKLTEYGERILKLEERAWNR